jgi:hypothetical protein
LALPVPGPAQHGSPASYAGVNPSLQSAVCSVKNVVVRLRVGIKFPKIWRRIFEPYSRRSLGSILKYVPKGATKKMAKKASHMGEFILIMGLTSNLKYS